MKAVLVALVIVFCNVVSPASFDPFALKELDSNKDLDLMDFERLLLADEQKDEIQTKRQIMEQAFMDEMIDSLGKRDLCKKDANEKLCKKYKRFCNIKFIKERCPRTCGVPCKMPAPPRCMSSKFGCCWDDSEATSLDKKDCPPCFDKYQRICYQFKDNCFKSSKVYMKKMCPQTCGYCDKYKAVITKK